MLFVLKVLRQYHRRTAAVSSLSLVDSSHGLFLRRFATLMTNRLPIESLNTQRALRDLQWMREKAVLAQNIMLLGDDVAYKRRLAMRFCDLCEMQFEMVSLSRDTSAADLRERRSLIQGSLIREAGPILRAAVDGRVLILDGIASVELNLLPLLNELLENRSMELEEGFLLSPSAYDRLSDDAKRSNRRLMRCSEQFLVIALLRSGGVSPIDPPLRSRFVARVVAPRITDAELGDHRPSDVDDSTWRSCTSFAQALDIGADYNFDADNNTSVRLSEAGLVQLARAVHRGFAWQPVFERVSGLASNFEDSSATAVKPMRRRERRRTGALTVPSTSANALRAAVRAAGDRLMPKSSAAATQAMRLASVTFKHEAKCCEATWNLLDSHQTSVVLQDVQCGDGESATSADFVATRGSEQALAELSLDHALARDVIIVGESGKSSVIFEFAARFGYAEPVVITLHSEYNLSNALMMRATSDVDGSVYWSDGPLVRAAVSGRLLIVEAIDTLPAASVYALLGRLCDDRQLSLPDGTRLVDARTYDAVDAIDAKRRGWRRIAPSFRVVCTAHFKRGVDETAALRELSGALSVVRLRMSGNDMRDILQQTALPASIDGVIASLLNARRALEGESVGARVPTLRDLRRAVLHARAASLAAASTETKSSAVSILNRSRVPPNVAAVAAARQSLERALLIDSLSSAYRRVISEILSQAGLSESSAISSTANVSVDDIASLAITNVHDKAYQHLVPKLESFEPIPAHLMLMRDIARDLRNGEHVLLMGLQGCGKNKIVESMLAIQQQPRLYVSLFSETTLASLTTLPVVTDGKLTHADAPLVRAARDGLVLIVDELDKARTEALSALVGVMRRTGLELGDGRRLAPVERIGGGAGAVVDDSSGVIRVHRNFRLIALANRAGAPFFGNSLQSVAEHFSNHGVPNLDEINERQLLARLAPNASAVLVSRVASLFAALRQLHLEGQLVYPFSSREAIAIVRHLNGFGDASVAVALESVFAHEIHDAAARALIRAECVKAGLLDAASAAHFLRRSSATSSTGASHISLDELRGPLSAPKFGKVDPQNEPHVGGHTWAGGTGGRDTAGLGGVGGPFRLDAGHPIYQVSDEIKAAVPREVLAAQRAAAMAALAARLESIGMSRDEHDLYAHYRDSVGDAVVQLRALLAAIAAHRHAIDANQGRRGERARGWLTSQSDGEIDDRRLIDALVGDRNVFRRRGDAVQRTPDWLRQQRKEAETRREDAEKDGKNEDDNSADRQDNDDDDDNGQSRKLISVVLDMSASMYRFNSLDLRLEKLLSTAVLLLESFDGVPNASANGDAPLMFELSGHSGDSAHIPLKRQPGLDQLAKFRLMQTIASHPQFCMSGDNTVESAAAAVDRAASMLRRTDVAFVVVVSDANFRRYGISASDLVALVAQARARRVALRCVFVADVGAEAARLATALGSEIAIVCAAPSALPEAIRRLVLASLRTT